jgi:hypothetical protein
VCYNTQGQEERIIFISTTLSKPESLPPPLPDVSAIEQQQLLQPQHGQRSSSGSWGLVGGVSDVGFWRNPKRFNVAITRAKALLVVVGSPRVLAADDNWRQLLRHCIARWAACCHMPMTNLLNQELHTHTVHFCRFVCICLPWWTWQQESTRHCDASVLVWQPHPAAQPSCHFLLSQAYPFNAMPRCLCAALHAAQPFLLLFVAVSKPS